MSCKHVNPTGQTTMEYFAKLQSLTKLGICCWMCHIDTLEALLRRVRNEREVYADMRDDIDALLAPSGVSIR